MIKKKIKNRDRRNRKKSVTVRINGKNIVATRICTNCGKIIEIHKGLCGICFIKKLSGEKVKE